MRLRKVWVSVFIFGSLSLSAQVALGQTYYVQSGDSLSSIAARYGTTPATLQQINGLNSSSVYPGQAIQITSGNARSASSGYVVRSGDTLYLLSQRYGVSIDALKRANNLSGNSLFPGQRLSIPTSGSSGSGTTTYRVQSGDSLYLIAKKYGITVEALRQANGISGNNLLAGQTLKIPSGSVSSGSTSYTVKSGDTLFLIAQRYGITVESLRQANNLSSTALYPGQALRIPQSASSSGGAGIFNLSQSDIDLLARLVSAESDGEPFTGQVAVAASILNRLEDPRYPKSIPGIVYQIDNGSYQYSPVLDGRINLPASSSAYQAVQSALSGWDPSNGGNGFYNPAKTTSQWVRSNPVTAVIGNHVFFSY